MSDQIERVGTDWVITNFYNVPYGYTFRYKSSWCVRTGTTEYNSSKDAGFHNMRSIETLIAMKFDDLPVHKKAYLAK